MHLSSPPQVIMQFSPVSPLTHLAGTGGGGGVVEVVLMAEVVVVVRSMYLPLHLMPLLRPLTQFAPKSALVSLHGPPGNSWLHEPGYTYLFLLAIILHRG